MAGGIEFKGAQKFLGNLRKLEGDQRKRQMSTGNKIGDVALKETRDRAPKLDGILEGAIQKAVQPMGDTVVIIIRVPLNTPAAAYAIRMHEEYYNLGELSEGKQARAGVKVGRKYITRGLAAAVPKCKVIVEKEMKT